MPGFFSFHKMVSASIIKFTYALGLVLISLWSLVAIGVGIAALAQPDEPTLRALVAGQPAIAIAAGALVLIFGNLFWRLACEGWILLFSMHELLATLAHGGGGSGASHLGYERKLT